MNILVINGSPKGKYSISLQTCLWWQKNHPEHSFEILHAGQRIKQLEKDFSPAVKAVEMADLLLFAYPVYTFIVPSQLHRFIELLKERNTDMSTKYAAQFSTSKHFYDITAQKFIEENALDLGLRYVDGLSADMEDLLSEKGREEAEGFFRLMVWKISQGDYRTGDCASAEPFIPVQATAVEKTVPEGESAGETSSRQKRIAVVSDLRPEDGQLKTMVERFIAVSKYSCDLVNIREFPFNGGCLGCFKCAATGKCVHKDGFDSFLRESIQVHDAIVIAFSIRDHSMGSLFKTYDDRQFCNGHRTVTMGTPFGYIISGRYSEEKNLQTIIEGRAEVGGNWLAGIANDEGTVSAEGKNPTDLSIDRLAANLAYALENAYTRPSNFLGVGGMKIFRDLIYQMRGLMRADHRFFKKHGQYDFPQKKWRQSLLMYLLGSMMGSPKTLAKMGNKINEGMIAPYRKLLTDDSKSKKGHE